MLGTTQLGLLLGMAASNAAAKSTLFGKRADSWGPAVSLGPSKSEIVSVTSTSYPGAPPQNQNGFLFLWPGISNGTGDLIQSIIGHFPAGQSQCTGPDADKFWCISAEVFGNDANGNPNQFIGTKETLLLDPADGVTFTYKLTDRTKYTWEQTVTNAASGVLLATFSKNSGPMVGYGTATECQEDCSGTVSTQTYVNTVITLKSADPKFSQTLGARSGATHSGMTTSDGGLTWKIDLMTIPAMNPGGAPAKSPGQTTPKKATTTTKSPTTTTTKKHATPTKNPKTKGTIPKGGRCAGTGYKGHKQCVVGTTCVPKNDRYSQCQ